MINSELFSSTDIDLEVRTVDGVEGHIVEYESDTKTIVVRAKSGFYQRYFLNGASFEDGPVKLLPKNSIDWAIRKGIYPLITPGWFYILMDLNNTTPINTEITGVEYESYQKALEAAIIEIAKLN